MYGHFGAVPNDANTLAALAIIGAVDTGQSQVAAMTLQQMDAATKNAVCQRAQDMLALPACTTGSEAEGTCFNPAGYANTPSALKVSVGAACKSSGATAGTNEILGLPKNTFYLLAGAVVVGGVILFAMRK